MDELKLIHTCNHRVVTRTIKEDSKVMTRSTFDYDILDVPNILNIVSITLGGVLVLPVNYFTQGQRLVWLPKSLTTTWVFPRVDVSKIIFESVNAVTNYVENDYGLGVPAAGEVYEITYKYMDAEMVLYNEYDCILCSGTNWYLSPAPVTGDISAVTGSMLVVQVFLKYLLTSPDTDRLAPNLGAGLYPSIGTRYFNNKLLTEIYNLVLTAETQARKELLDRETSDLTELLDHVDIITTDFDPDSGKTYLEIKIITVGGETISFGMVQ